MHAAAGSPRQLQDRAAVRGLAAAAFADQTERTAAGEVEAYAVHGPHELPLAREPAATNRKPFAEVADLEQRRLGGGRQRPQLVRGNVHLRSAPFLFGDVASSFANQQSELRPGSISSKEGSSLHFSAAIGQRSRNRQPSGICVGVGTFPSIDCNRLRLRSARTKPSSRPWV